MCSLQAHMILDHRCEPSCFRRDCTDFDYYVPLSHFTKFLSRSDAASNLSITVNNSSVQQLEADHVVQ